MREEENLEKEAHSLLELFIAKTLPRQKAKASSVCKALSGMKMRSGA